MRGRPGRPVQKRPATERIFMCQGEAAWLAGVSLHTFQAWRAAGLLAAVPLAMPALRQKKYRVYRLADVLDVARRQRR